MADKETLSVKTMVIYGIVVVIVAFIGVLAGNWYVQWRQDQSMAPVAENWQLYNQSAFLEGDEFPSEELFDMDSNVVDAAQLIAGHKTLFLFIAPGCEPCVMAIEDWKKEADQVPSDMTVIGLAVGGVSDVLKYREKTGFPFEVFADPEFLYAQQYDMSSFPSMLAVDEQGKVAFVMQGYHEGVKLRDVYDYLVEKGSGN